MKWLQPERKKDRVPERAPILIYQHMSTVDESCIGVRVQQRRVGLYCDRGESVVCIQKGDVVSRRYTKAGISCASETSVRLSHEPHLRPSPHVRNSSRFRAIVD